MSTTAEQQMISEMFPNDNTKTFNDVINKLIQDSFPNLTSEELKTMLKTTNPSTEWSF
tara:strand:+ start:279 stop:452 length:174 start_codon:yes stop_codon:yes gene_type:complete